MNNINRQFDQVATLICAELTELHPGYHGNLSMLLTVPCSSFKNDNFEDQLCGGPSRTNKRMGKCRRGDCDDFQQNWLSSLPTRTSSKLVAFPRPYKTRLCKQHKTSLKWWAVLLVNGTDNNDPGTQYGGGAPLRSFSLSHYIRSLSASTIFLLCPFSCSSSSSPFLSGQA